MSVGRLRYVPDAFHTTTHLYPRLLGWHFDSMGGYTVWCGEKLLKPRKGSTCQPGELGSAAELRAGPLPQWY